ncbi:MAG: hypothetical protein GEU28_00385 [Dehalococcoidia bacterium]|nr:hypothetical protein [Dehalococcoidia bacterium]
MPRSIVVTGPDIERTTLAAAIAHRLHLVGREALLLTMGSANDPGTARTAAFYGGLPYGIGVNPLGLSQAASMLGDLGSAVIVADVPADDAIGETVEKLDAVVVVAGSAAAHLPIAPERFAGEIDVSGFRGDRLLMAPTVSRVLAALPAETTVRFIDGKQEALCEDLLIAPIAHDTGRLYFGGADHAVVVCRDDKPELALSALAGNTTLLVITGGDEPLGYVAERAAAASTPLAITRETTFPTVQRIETTFAPGPPRSLKQVERAASIMAHIDPEALLR